MKVLRIMTLRMRVMTMRVMTMRGMRVMRMMMRVRRRMIMFWCSTGGRAVLPLLLTCSCCEPLIL